jgi:Arc/MetJ family transcription regulator
MGVRRTTIEIDEELLANAKQALGLETTRATVEEALRQATERADSDRAERAERQRALLKKLPQMLDVQVLASNEMWR